MYRPRINKFTIEIEANVDPAYYPWTVRAAGIEFSGKSLRAVLRKLADALADVLEPKGE